MHQPKKGLLHRWHPQGPIHSQPPPVPLHVIHSCSHTRRTVAWWRGGSPACRTPIYRGSTGRQGGAALALTHVRKGVAARFIAPGREGGCEARPHRQRHSWRGYARTGRLTMCRGEGTVPPGRSRAIDRAWVGQRLRHAVRPHPGAMNGATTPASRSCRKVSGREGWSGGALAGNTTRHAARPYKSLGPLPVSSPAPRSGGHLLRV